MHPRVDKLFFALKWMVRYHHDLVKLPSTLPDVFDEFKNGFFSIHHIEKSFSGSPINLTLEQTNADAGNQKKGIINNQFDWCLSTLGRITFFKDGPSHSDVQQSLDEQERRCLQRFKTAQNQNRQRKFE